ncbi:hypothetical protein [Terasakiella sp.]|uniref:hypothetical protein n=1 Tax=Terasakiella sp. TaxID=2034861 RepID=UPI003AA88BD0
MVDIFSALKNGQGAVSIFNVSKNVSRNQLAAQLQTDFQNKVQNAETQVQDRLNAKMAIVDRKGKAFSDLTKNLREALDVLQNSRKRVESIERRLDSMMLDVNRAQKSFDDPDTDFQAEGYARAFDSGFRSIDLAISETRVSPNLLNNSTYPMEYPTNSNGGYSSFFGVDLSANYSLEEAGGEVWKLESSGSSIRRYDADGNETNVVASFVSGLTLNSIDASDNVSFSVGSDASSSTTYNATIKRAGIGIMHAWAYDDLATDSGRARALEDLSSAKSIAQLEVTRYEVVETSLKFYLEKAKNEIDGINQEKVNLQRELMTELYDKRQKLQQQFQATQSNLAQAFLVRSNYASLIPSGSMGDFFNLLT